MVTKVTMPKLAENIEEATVGQWLKAEGDRVAAGEPLFEAITDKAAVEVRAEGAGVLRKIWARENSVVPVGKVIAVIAEPDDELPVLEAPQPAEGPAAVSVKASFGARRLAKQLGIDLAGVAASRPDGRVSEEDVRRAAGGDASLILQRIPLSPLKRALAEHLTHTARNVASSLVTMETDFSGVLSALPSLGREAGVAVQPRDVLIHFAARLLPRHRLLNACFREDGIILYRPIHIGLAIDIERDDCVMVPVLRDADQKSLAEIAREAAELVERLRAHALGPGDLANATFTIADQSALGIDQFVPILNDRQSAILAMSTIRPRPVTRGGALAVAPVASLTVAFDHRVLNGTTAARFLSAVKDGIERFKAQ